MRTKTLLAAAVLAAGIATSMAQSNVYSINVVGYVNKVYDTGPGKFVMVANPLNATNNTIPALFQNPKNNMIVYKWGGASFDPYGYVANTWAPAALTTSLNPGEGAFLSFGSVAAGTYTNTYVGEVLQGSLTNPAPAGFALMGSKVPQAGGLQTVLGYPVVNNMVIYKWNTATAQFSPYGYVGGLWGVAGEPQIDVAEGFFGFRPVGSGTVWVRNFTVQ